MLGTFNALQIITLQILLRIEIPINVSEVLLPIQQLANFDVYQTDTAYEEIFGFGETEPFDQVFEEAEFEGSNFIVGIGPLFIVVVINLLILIPGYYLFRYIRGKNNIRFGYGRHLITP